MSKQHFIPLSEFCNNHNVEISFIHSLHQNGLVEITTREESAFIEEDQLSNLEKIVRFYYEMDINLEGIETISYLLQKMNLMQEELTTLRNRLRFYEATD